MSESVSTVLDINYLVTTIQSILNKSHQLQEKKRIMPVSDSSRSIQFACPICGDSRKKDREKRGHIYLNSLRFKCYNEDCERTTPTFTALCKRFNVTIDLDKKVELINYIEANVQYKPTGDDYASATMDKLIHIDDLTRIFNDNTQELTEFKPIEEGSRAYYYLKQRKLNYKDETFYQAKRWITPDWSEKVIVFLNRRGDHVLGMQTRNMKQDKNKRFFKIYNFETLYNMVHEENIDETDAIVYNKLSYFFNILNVDFGNVLTIFEGYTDSIFYPNSIGLVGLDTDLDFLLKSGAELQFFFDYDKPGMYRTMNMMNKGEKVFLWEKMFKDLIKGKPDPYTLYNKLIKVKDLNKLAEIIHDPYKKLQLYNYFSIDKFDNMYINFKNFN